MAKGQISNKKTSEVVRVYCSDCRWFVRDTEGRSYCRETGEYFMGVCSKGLHPDTSKKQFANKPRTCKIYRCK